MSEVSPMTGTSFRALCGRACPERSRRVQIPSTPPPQSHSMNFCHYNRVLWRELKFFHPQRSTASRRVVLGMARVFSADFYSRPCGMTYDVPWTTFGGCCQWVLDAVRQTVEWPSAIRVRVPCPPQSLGEIECVRNRMRLTTISAALF